MSRLFDVELVPASVDVKATFADAAETLTSYPVSTIAIVDEARRVVGLFAGSDLLEGLFPAYLKELRHTAFTRDDATAIARRAGEVGAEPVERHMQPPETVGLDSSTTHVAERFLHTDVDALPVVADERFVGMLGRSEFCRAMLARAEARADSHG